MDLFIYLYKPGYVTCSDRSSVLEHYSEKSRHDSEQTIRNLYRDHAYRDMNNVPCKHHVLKSPIRCPQDPRPLIKTLNVFEGN